MKYLEFDRAIDWVQIQIIREQRRVGLRIGSEDAVLAYQKVLRRPKRMRRYSELGIEKSCGDVADFNRKKR